MCKETVMQSAAAGWCARILKLTKMIAIRTVAVCWLRLPSMHSYKMPQHYLTVHFVFFSYHQAHQQLAEHSCQKHCKQHYC
jgi:hypothetical protein